MWNRYAIILVAKYVIQFSAVSQEVSVQPERCICPTESYWCRADLAASVAIENSALSEPFTYAIDLFVRPQIMRDGLRISFSKVSSSHTLSASFEWFPETPETPKEPPLQ